MTSRIMRRVREQAPRVPGVTRVALEESVWAGDRRSRSWRWRGRRGVHGGGAPCRLGLGEGWAAEAARGQGHREGLGFTEAPGR